MALLEDAHRASLKGQPLYYCKQGFRTLRARSRIHSFMTARAAERRSLVITTGQAPFRKLHITGHGLDTVAKSKRKP